jgi:NAD(P)H-flavin reductase
MPIPTHTIVCTRNALIARDVYEFALTKPAGFIFKPGQFVLFEVALLDNPADVQTRAFSIASTPEEEELIFVAKLVRNGRASAWIEKKLMKGSEVKMKGPFGNFLLDETSDRELLFIATSTGIAPFRSQILAALKANSERRIDLIYGVRSEEDVFWAKEFEDVQKNNPHFFLHITLSAPSSSWKGYSGRVQGVVPHIIKDFSRKTLYACGSPEMTKDIKNRAMTEWGMDKRNVHVEGYI